jgi:hypothetical protein
MSEQQGTQTPGRTLAERFCLEQVETAGRRLRPSPALERPASDLAFLGAFFDVHVLEFAGLEDFATLLTFHEL